MPSRRILLVAVAVGVTLVGGSVALDATTPDRVYTYEVSELPATPEHAAESIVDDTTVTPDGPSAVFVASSGSGDRPERRALREAATDSLPKAAFPGSLIDHQYAVVGSGGAVSEVSAVYRLHEHEDGGTERVAAERVSLSTFYDELAVSAAKDSRLRELVRKGELRTHDHITVVLIASDGQYYHVMQPPQSAPYAGVETDLHNAGYLIGIPIVLLAGGWYAFDRWGGDNWRDGSDAGR